MSKCYIVAGPNGAGKTTFATTFLPAEDCLHFVNADMIAAGVSPLRPEAAARLAGRIFLTRLDELAVKGESFGFESTLSGKTYTTRMRAWKEMGYAIHIYYLKLKSVELAVRRVKHRVEAGGHDVPEVDIRRRYDRSWHNFLHLYTSGEPMDFT